MFVSSLKRGSYRKLKLRNSGVHLLSSSSFSPGQVFRVQNELKPFISSRVTSYITVVDEKRTEKSFDLLLVYY